MSTTAASPHPTSIPPPPPPPSTNTAFPFPPHYHYPPFFSLQPTASTRLSQLHSWSTLIQSYCRHHRLFALSLVDALDSDLFWNRKLGKRLALRDAREVIAWMAGTEGGERAEWVDGTGKKGRGEEGRCWVYWRRPEEWAGLIEAWVDATAQRGTVLTLYELAEGDATRSQEFHGMDMELLQKSLQVLVKKGKAQIFGSDDQQGIKFF
ncbi:ESCRT-II complex, vps25 subunit [Eremomyces bilateralis CBS 781.70]|uniref:Vacuolar protein-sorting-associated protein 25 n=1 Tax=Eremomyces bilateralis CBS 781.70 TaxID=1392243 RepID=A0A6G1GFQ4_9PEZI|nr:ESCRT-II complex, vps25 subunit [Eremomyces bilateralis CBS 781.70]KAF1816935.1 ESCRT-II complex, vps25 subunit [Eremomyces bilateralis CBS 781.70]